MGDTEHTASVTPEVVRPPYTDPLTIHNLRHAPFWMLNGIAIIFVYFLAFMPCVALAVILKSGAAVGFGIIFAGLVSIIQPWTFPARRITLDEKGLHVFPGRFFDMEHICSITIAPDPHEDFAEDSLPIRVFQVTIEPQFCSRFCLIISEGETERLIAWARINGITVRDKRTVALITESHVGNQPE
jgi:hypothetical protein